MRAIMGGLAIVAALGLTSTNETYAQANIADATNPEVLRDHYRLAEALRLNNTVPGDVTRGMALHNELMNAGYAPSMRRMAIAHFYGTEAELDRGRSIALLRQAIRRDDQDSRVWLGRVLLAVGGYPEEAYEVLTRATADKLIGADFHLAVGHARRGYGEKSDPALGIEILSRLSDAGNPAATFELATAYRQAGGTVGDPAKARVIFQGLVDAGNAKAGEELGEMYRDGVGGTADPEHAARLFAWARENGRSNATGKLTNILLTMGRPSEARDVLADSAANGEKAARLELALGDIGGKFGTASDPVAGKAALAEFAANPDGDTAYRVAQFVRLQTLPEGVDVTEIAGILEASAASGDGRSAEALLRLLRQRPEFIANALDRRLSVLETHGNTLRSKAFVEETMRILGETTSNASGGPEAVKLLASADADAYQSGLTAAFQTNKNLYVYILQTEMVERGLYSGDIDGVARGSTMRAIGALCQSGGFGRTCAAGPLGSDAAKALATYLGAQRAEAS